MESSEARRLRLVLEYDGTEFCGFQRQPDRRTVQGHLEAQLSALLEHEVQSVGAGRTDTGVHALGQVVHFDTTSPIPADRLEWALNKWIGPEMRVRRVEATDAAFHARFSAQRRTYQYWISRERPSPFWGRYVLHERMLAEDARKRIEAALPALMGRQDFAPFGATGGTERTTVRTMLAATVRECGPVLRLEFTADAFLRSMVRMLVGLLLQIGRGRREPDATRAVLAGSPREPAATAPAHGLCLVRVDYPDGYGTGAGESLWGGPAEWGTPDWR